MIQVGDADEPHPRQDQPFLLTNLCLNSNASDLLRFGSVLYLEGDVVDTDDVDTGGQLDLEGVKICCVLAYSLSVDSIDGYIVTVGQTLDHDVNTILAYRIVAVTDSHIFQPVERSTN